MKKMMQWVLVLVLAIGVSGGPAFAQGFGGGGFGQPAAAAPLTLKKERIERLLKMIPELARATAQYQGQFLSSLAAPGGAGTLPQISNPEMERLQKIYAKHGFTLEEFIMELSVLVATYFALDKEAFAAMLPSEDKPEIKAMLSNPEITPAQKEQIRAQIKQARLKQGELRKYLEAQTTPANMAVLKPMLPKVRGVFREVEKLTRAAPKAAPKKSSAPAPAKKPGKATP